MFRSFKITIGHDNMRTALSRLDRRFATDSARAADNDEDLAAEFSLWWLTGQLRFFQIKIFNAKRFGRREGDIVVLHRKCGVQRGGSRLRYFGRRYPLIQRRGPFHDVDGVDVKFSRDARFRLAFAKAEHSDTRYNH